MGFLYKTTSSGIKSGKGCPILLVVLFVIITRSSGGVFQTFFPHCNGAYTAPNLWHVQLRQNAFPCASRPQRGHCRREASENLTPWSSKPNGDDSRPESTLQVLRPSESLECLQGDLWQHHVQRTTALWSLPRCRDCMVGSTSDCKSWVVTAVSGC